MDADILFEYIQSQEIVSEVESKLDIRNHYSSNWPSDFLFSIWPDATSEELNWFWQRFVNLSYDKSSGLIEVQVLAFDPQTAQDIATEIVKLSQSLINDLSIQAREDATRYARDELEVNLVRLKAAREALTGFRTRTQILDPAADIQARMGVLQNLQQQLAQTLIEHDMLSETVNASDPRIEKFQRRIEVIRQRIASEGQTYASARTTTGAVGEDYPLLLAEYESLMIDQQFAEETYRVALAALDVAKAKAARQSRYLAVYIQPTKAEKSEYPRRFVLLGLTALLLLLLWSTLVLIYYSVRDRG
ncbi:sugar transporter [Phaeobacter sp. 11ANDIMAR09]|uniref:sugar transporter n=1 Tax=Phaeobacter sp. 11ANDIMAR09 TaxID=1225647 RepID=UPI00155DD544|nr:sugar transporter [Phaeobacter sp. 11ANDIMAR09]